jgi:SWI/SNF-related matrix-associated actin-dependent regulator 1 of chromatin subfamily A
MAEEMLENGQKVIIFSCFTNTIKELQAHFGKKAVTIDGSVSKEKRQQAVDQFQTDDKITVFLGNIVAAGVGLTLTESSVVIFNDLDWTPANHMQAEDRAHRIGQQNQVHIIYPLFADTLDMIMYKALQSKMKIISTIMGDNPSEEEISVGKEVIMHLRR